MLEVYERLFFKWDVEYGYKWFWNLYFLVRIVANFIFYKDKIIIIKDRLIDM